MDDLLDEFLTETSERMARLDSDLAALERDPGDSDLLDEIHALLRMIGGTSSFLNLPDLESLARAADAVVDGLRTGDIAMTGDVHGLIQTAFDRIGDSLAHLRETGEEPGRNKDRDRLVEGLASLAETGRVSPGVQTGAPPSTKAAPPPEPTPKQTPEQAQTDPAGDPDTVRVKRKVLENLMRMVSELGATRNQLMDILRHREDGAMQASLRRLSEVTTGLRQGVLQAQSKPLAVALVVQCRGQRFAIPQTGIAEIVSVGEASDNTVEHLRTAAVLRRGDRILPLINLASLFGLDAEKEDDTTGASDDFVVVLKQGDARYGLVVDAVLNTETILVQPVASVIRSIPYYAGSAVLDDGSVVMVLQPGAFAPLALSSRNDPPAIGNHPEAYLLFRVGGDRPMAAPLTQIVRLEEVDFDDVEIDDTGVTVPYGGQSLSLVTIGKDIDLPQSGRKPVLVIGTPDRPVGLVVDEVFDIVDTRVALQPFTAGPGLLGSAVLSDKLTEIIDAAYYCAGKKQQGKPLAPVREAALPVQADAKQVLLVDNSAYIRNLLSPLLLASGYAVLTAATGEQALELCESRPDIAAILCDTDLPDMSGFAFVETLRSDERWSDLPVVAVSSRAAPDAMQRGHRAGFTDYVEKYNRDGLLQALAEHL